MTALPSRRSLALLAVLVGLAPVFAWAAGAVGYAEPVANAAAATGAASHAEPTAVAPFPGYAVPGLGPAAGTLVAGAVGTLLTLAAATGLGRLLGGAAR